MENQKAATYKGSKNLNIIKGSDYSDAMKGGYNTSKSPM